MTASRRLVLVLGSGRSGSSLLMRILLAMGLRASDQLIAPSPENPEGFFEDARVVRCQANLLRALGAWPFLPLPQNWREHPATAAAKEELRALLRAGMAQPGLWGVKDPRVSSFLPLWHELLREEAIAPLHLLALRDLGATVRSFQRSYGVSAEMAEDVWRRRVGDVLRHTRGTCLVLHYEDWFRQPEGAARTLAQFTGLSVPAPFPLHLIQPDLDRCGGGNYRPEDGETRRLWETLRDFRGVIQGNAD